MRLLIFVLFTTFASSAMADGYARVTDRVAFINLVEGKNLTSLGVSLSVSPSGGISGSAFGRDVSGAWTWNNGYFCRTMQAGDKVFARNCQLVQQQGDRLRFVADKGTGETANLRIR